MPHPEPSSLLPPHTILLGCPSALAPRIQYRASNLDWQLVSYMIFYMFQCHSPKFPTLSLSHRVHKTVLYFRKAFMVNDSMAFPSGSDSKVSAYNAGDTGSIHGWGRSPGEGNVNPLQYSCLENPMDIGAW